MEDDYWAVVHDRYVQMLTLRAKMVAFRLTDKSPPRRCDHCQAAIRQGWGCAELTLCQFCFDQYGR